MKCFYVPLGLAQQIQRKGTHRLFGINWRRNSSSTPLDFTQYVYTVRVNACAELYTQWYDNDVHKGKPLRGIDFDVAYLDTHPKAPSSTPIILALHGTRGSLFNFSKLVPILTAGGARVIVPDLPGCGLTKSENGNTFTQSDQERAAFITDFLNAIEISKVSLLLSHSSTAYPSMYLMQLQDVFQSLALLSPGGHRLSSTFIFPLWVYQFLVVMMERRALRFLTYLIRLTYANRLDANAEEFLMYARNIFLVNYDYIARSLKECMFRNLPMLLLHTTNDNLVDQEVFQEMAGLLELKSGEKTMYSETGQLIQPGQSFSDRRPAKWVVIEGGNHFPMKTHPEIVGKQVLELLNYVINRPVLSKVKVMKSS